MRGRLQRWGHKRVCLFWKLPTFEDSSLGIFVYGPFPWLLARKMLAEWVGIAYSLEWLSNFARMWLSPWLWQYLDIVKKQCIWVVLEKWSTDHLGCQVYYWTTRYSSGSLWCLCVLPKILSGSVTTMINISQGVWWSRSSPMVLSGDPSKKCYYRVV